ncbi:4'-phosphopantetheinyl transferase superfamily protein [Streptomyces sp. A012304]|uniref:4'-phosphopantetheinyl transferase family protein n=1 Tax=Streptomyces sp. A012304 TaxID=375446 RepID=UPI00222F72F5|nr:4'-phosphopantetheinyl transferase superfamily protein [Streptomyces sp. A012304]GKQ35462.1 4'-phosphopantetheinyl transferase [Streptomyces sp. A012304]
MHLWWARRGDARAGLLRLLDPVERRRYEATVGPADRDRFLVGCALSRHALGELLGLPPAEVPLRRVCPRCGGPHGKVTLDAGHPDVDLSVTHSGTLIGVAVCRGAAVGLDAEEWPAGPVEGLPDIDSAARVALTDTERTALYARPAAERPAAFLRTWTRKEAVLKALGVGLRAPLRRLEVSAPEAPPTVLTWPEQIAAPAALSMADLTVDDMHPAAVAVTAEGGLRLLRHDGSALLAG